MVKRVVDTKFWTDMNVIDHYSPEDKFFYLYLITNGKTSQVGIYPLPIKVISFETGYSPEAVTVLLDRFSESYKQIRYSKETQEITILKSLEFTILKGGKPVQDLIERELTQIKDSHLILATYEAMRNFWTLSKRPFDQIIQAVFEKELENRGMFNLEQENKKSEVSPQATKPCNLEEKFVIKPFADSLIKKNPELKGTITFENIVEVYYGEMIGEVHNYLQNQLEGFKEQLPTSLVLEALSRSVNAEIPILYTQSLIDNWVGLGIKCLEDLNYIEASKGVNR